MVRVAVLDDYQGVALESADWSAIPDGAQVQVFRDHMSDSDRVGERLRDFEVIAAMRERTPFPRELLDQLPRLLLLVTTGMRNASIDVDAATELGIVVCGTGGLGYPTAELTWGLILSLARHIPREDAATRQGRWQTTVGAGLQGKVLGVLGLGRLGSQVAAIGKAFGMSVIAWSQNLTAERTDRQGVALVAKDELFSRSDILSIHLQLSERTVGLMGSRELGLMKPTAYLVNTSRGPIVDEAALVKALQSHALAGAGLDVFDDEPLPAGHALLQLDNTVLTPHVGYVTGEGYKIFYEETVQDIIAYLSGDPVRVLNPAALERPRRQG